MTSRQPSAAFWITVALVAVLVGYPLSFGPACWLIDLHRDLIPPGCNNLPPHRPGSDGWSLDAAASASEPMPNYSALRHTFGSAENIRSDRLRSAS